MKVHHPPIIPYLFPSFIDQIFLQIELFLLHSVSFYAYISLSNTVILKITTENIFFSFTLLWS